MIVEASELKEQVNKIYGFGHSLIESNQTLYEDKRINRKVTMQSILEGIKDPSMKSHTAVMLNNVRSFIDNMDETTRMINIGDWEKYAFDMVRTVFPNLAAHNLASVQPLLGPVGLVFFMKFIYGRTKGAAVAGQDIVENPNEAYASEEIDREEVGTGTGAATNFTGNLIYLPLKPGTIVFKSTASAVELEVTDDGNGAIIGDIGAGTNTINYTTGAFNFDFSGAPDIGEDVYAEYSYDSEGSDETGEIDMQITSSPVVAKKRKLRTRWSVEAQQDLRNAHGLEAEIEQVSAINNEMKFEIDRELITNMTTIAQNSVTAFSKTPDTGVSYTEHKLQFVDTLTEASNSIFSSTQRAIGTWLVGGVNVANLIETLPGFVSKPRPKGTRAVYNAGNLNGQWDFWKDPNFTTDNFLMGYRGDSMYEVGFIFAPYILGYTTASIMLDDMVGRKGMMSRYGKKAIEGKFYCTGSITT
jgi:hypothetical protein